MKQPKDIDSRKIVNSVLDQMKKGVDVSSFQIDSKKYAVFSEEGFEKFVVGLTRELMKEIYELE